ncbi:pyocin knob domain-containing protein [Levilactobacillus acidifarinae]|uniref:Uncharacterized protein n=1 Tax=Levilactobacillus acidifarinae DSM 19394 = JCM 15949 TaxID=1423715 RepID=A0A0R1LL17_9LACO|nr:pyocin knob domain-containing protein [Levilactobacillus acidifarinae]KRK96517.1 hypothetical protein FD25_GL002014 [Levilactobacillus acidifarinae DSM 19394]GEO70425.1 hypothetical protein LAC03_23350 [Levilactobacillus acidifarinae]
MNYKSSMTDIGTATIASADKAEKAIIFDDFLITEADLSGETDLTKSTVDLFSSPLMYPINSKSTLGNTFTVKAVLANKTEKLTVDQDFHINAIGIMAHIEGDTDSKLMTIAVADGSGAVITAFKDTLYSLTVAITQAYQADRPADFKLANVAYALAEDLDKLKTDVQVIIDSDLADVAKTNVDNKFSTKQTFEQGATDGQGNAMATTKDVDTVGEAKVNVTDTANWQKQAMFGAGSYTAGTVPTGSDYATYVKAQFAKPGVYFVRDDKTSTTIDGQPLSVVDSMLTSEGAGYFYASGVSVAGDSVFRAISPTSDTGWKRAVESHIMGVTADGKTDVNTSLIAMSQKAGFYSAYIQNGAINNPSKDSIRGILHSNGGGFASGTFHSNQGDNFSSYSVVVQNGTIVTWKHLATFDDIAPSSLLGRNLTGNDDVFNLGPGVYPIVGTAPKNGIPGITWGWVQVFDNGNRFLRWFDVNGHEQINTYLGSPAHWSGWRAPNSMILNTGSDLNALMTTGFYMLNGVTVTHLPSGLSGNQWMSLVVKQIAGSNGTQTLIDSNTGRVWVRGWHSVNGIVFTPWTEMASVSALENSGVLYQRTLTANDDILNLDDGTYYYRGATPKSLPTGVDPSWGKVVSTSWNGGNEKQVDIYSLTGSHYFGIYSGGVPQWGGWKHFVTGNTNGTITVNSNTYAPVQSDPTSGNVAKVHNFVNGVKINGHLINVDPTNGLTIDGTPLINTVADEATAKAKSANDKLHLWVTKE